MLTLGFTESDLKQILKPGEFANLRIIRGKSPKWTEQGEAMMFFNGEQPFLAITKNDANEINRIFLLDGFDRELIQATIKDDKISELVVLGNKKLSGLYLTRYKDSDSGLWTARYSRIHKGMPVTESYADIDYDGQFDVKRHFNSLGNMIISESIFINNKWQEVQSCDIDNNEAYAMYFNGIFQRISAEDTELVDKLTALPQNAKEQVYYDFEFGKGWKKREAKDVQEK